MRRGSDLLAAVLVLLCLAVECASKGVSPSGKKTTPTLTHSLTPFTLSRFDLDRQQQWDHRTEKYQYHSIVTGQHEQWYSDHRVSLVPKRSGVRGASAIIDDIHRVMMCTIPKVGSSTWRKFMLYLSFPDIDEAHGKKHYFEKYGVKRPDFHNISKNGLKLVATQHPDVAVEYYNDPSMLKLFHCRNPLTRLLSAWLSKNAKSKDPKPFAMVHSTFEKFVKVHYMLFLGWDYELNSCFLKFLFYCTFDNSISAEP